MKRNQVVALVGGAAVALGAFMPWASIRSLFFSVSVNGTEGDGRWTWAVGVVGALAVYLRPASKWWTAIVSLASLGVVASVINAWHNVSVGAGDDVVVQLGAGLVLSGVGAVALIVGALMGDGESQAVPAPLPPPTLP